MNYNNYYEILNYCDIETIIKLIEVDKNIINLVSKELLINKVFDLIAVIEVIKYNGPDQNPDFQTVDIYEDQELNIEDKIKLIDMVISINEINIKCLYCAIYYHRGDLDFDKFLKFYNLVCSSGSSSTS